MYIKEEEHYTFSMFPKEENEVWMFEIYVDKTIEGSRSFNIPSDSILLVWHWYAFSFC